MATVTVEWGTALPRVSDTNVETVEWGTALPRVSDTNVETVEWGIHTTDS